MQKNEKSLGRKLEYENIPNFREMGKSKLGKKFRIIKKSPCRNNSK